MVMKTHKKKKSKGQRGDNTYGHGARKKWKGSGHHGGVGMAGTGKRADHKKSLVIKLFGNKYFGKQGQTSKSTERKKAKVMNLENIQKNLDSLMKKYGNPKNSSKNFGALKIHNNREDFSGGKELILKDYKILGEGELNQAVKIKAKAFSESAKEKIEKAGGEAILLKIQEEEKVEIEQKEEKPVKTKKASSDLKSESHKKK